MSKQIYRELLEAGAPELPEGWFYQIDDNSVYWVGIKVRVCRRRKRWFPKLLGECSISREVEDGDWDIERLSRACTVAHMKAVKSTQPRPDHLGELRRFIGRHP